MPVVTAFEIGHQLADRAVPCGRVFCQRLLNNRVEIGIDACVALARWRHRTFSYGLDGVCERCVFEVVRQRAGGQLVKQQTELVDVAANRNGRAANLFGACVGQRQRAAAGLGPLVRQGAEQCCDAEIKQPGPACGVDKDVRRFDIAMNDEPLMRVLQRRTYLKKQRELLIDRALCCNVDDIVAFDVFHREPGTAVREQTAIQQPGDTRMLQRREYLSFAKKACLELIVRAMRPQNLDGRLLHIVGLVAHREPDLAHTT